MRHLPLVRENLDKPSAIGHSTVVRRQLAGVKERADDVRLHRAS